MAQHIPISGLKQKVFRKIENSITRDFQGGLPTGSLKYEWLKRILRGNDYQDYRHNENDEVFTTERYIGKGFIWGSNRGSFEIHFDRKHKDIIEIYLVA